MSKKAGLACTSPPHVAALGPLFASVPPADLSLARNVLQEHFGFGTFRTGQKRAIESFLAGKDVEVVLPTGGGKSLCYQVPAQVLASQGKGPTLVVSPLVALMQDQVEALRRRNIPAVAFYRGMDSAERRRGLRGDVALIYASPERLALSGFRRRLQDLGVARLAIDEAHCISEWGHDFRKDYMQLGELRASLGIPTMALTATATPKVLQEIRGTLALREPVQVHGSFERPNLRFVVEHHQGDRSRVARLIGWLQESGLGTDPEAGRVVVYAATRKRVKAVADALKAAGLKAGFYHAGRTDSARERAQQQFERGVHAILVATTAFGMGIDLPNVRLVAHVQAPGTLEAYYQQAGRAGRDGAPADCVLLYAPGDAMTQARLRGDSPAPGAVAGWKALQDYAYGTGCRQAALVAWFSGTPGAPCERCDVCGDPDAAARSVAQARERLASSREQRVAKRAADLAVTATDAQRQTIVDFVGGLKKPVGRTVLVGGLRGSQAQKIKQAKLTTNPHFGALRELPEAAVLREVDQLLEEGQLVRKGRKYPTVWLPNKRVRSAPGTGAPKREPRGLRAKLRDFRKREARRRRIKPYQVFPDTLLDAILNERPTTPAELMALPGMGPTRMSRMGSQLLELIRQA